ncbi:MAG: hypothetical protein SOR73_12880 [Romboutsia timonensis]|uniref:hypothetical protein n=1 Tax=Romboutsia timonensis TaxID=1776391 RepID=UPI002A75C069|nr:hypothetical protein [Romboutsia timonensis]MDY3002548.1 hypothetical protein [Romboutsia timonensis]
MKKWNKPELLSSGVENTFTECTCDTSIVADPNNNGNIHYCNYDGATHQNNCSRLNEDHQ